MTDVTTRSAAAFGPAGHFEGAFRASYPIGSSSVWSQKTSVSERKSLVSIPSLCLASEAGKIRRIRTGALTPGTLKGGTLSSSSFSFVFVGAIVVELLSNRTQLVTFLSCFSVLCIQFTLQVF